MIAQADAIRIPLPDKSVHCAVTSPPYWGLRKYAGVQDRIWGGDPECEHEWGELLPEAHKSGLHIGGTLGADKTDGGRSDKSGTGSGQFCQLCGAWYGSLGLEPTPEQHVENIVEICREVRRVLRDDGVFWLNYGDSYFGDSPVRTSGAEAFSKTWDKSQTASRGGNRRSAARHAGFQPGSLAMMPHRVAIALAEDGWIVRQDLVWYKRNPMPESVNGWRWQREREKKDRSNHAKKHNIKGGTEAMLRDASIHQGIGPDWVPEYEYGDDLELRKGSWRHTRAHEYVFMLVKGMQYFSNQEAVREAIQSGPSDIRKMEEGLDRIGGKHKILDDPLSKASAATRIGQKRSVGNPSGRNPRSVLDVPTAPYKGAHYATFPPNLIAPLIRATCPRWACPVCGQGWAAVVEAPFVGDNIGKRHSPHASGHLARPPAGAGFKGQVLGYKSTCEHEHTQEEAVPGIVFDPFLGSGTVGFVAKELQRRWIGVDISMEYLDEQARYRTNFGEQKTRTDDLPLFK